MPTGRQTNQTARAGEHYVVAELNRRGYDAVTFTGNMPGMDAIAVTPNNTTIYIQVKAQTGQGWLVNINERTREPIPDMFWMLVLLPKTGEPPRYWTIPDKDMRGVIQGQYKDRPDQFEGEGKARNMCRVKVEAVKGWEGRWDLLSPCGRAG